MYDGEIVVAVLWRAEHLTESELQTGWPTSLHSRKIRLMDRGSSDETKTGCGAMRIPDDEIDDGPLLKARVEAQTISSDLFRWVSCYIYDVRNIFGFFCPCYCHKSADFVPFVCFLGTPSPTHCGRHIRNPPTYYAVK